jgi:MFS family permease
MLVPVCVRYRPPMEHTSPAASARPRLARNVLALGFVSLFTDASSEMIYPLLPVFLTTTLGASAAALGVVEGIAETTAGLLKLWSGTWSDRLTRRKPLVLAGYTLSAFARPLVAAAGAAWHVLAVRVTDRVGKGVRSSPRDALIADSTDKAVRGRAFGYQRAMDHLGAVVGPLIAYTLLNAFALNIRTVFWLAAIPGVLSVAVLAIFVRETRRQLVLRASQRVAVTGSWGALPPVMKRYLAILLLFTLSTSSDAFLLLRASTLGVSVAMVPVLWAVHHVIKSAASTPAGALSDRVGRRPLIATGWILYALVYVGFAAASAQWHIWALFIAYGAFYALTEGVEKAFVADLVGAEVRGSAFGWYNLTVAIGALPASVVFGFLWTRGSPALAFGTGASIALVATLLLVMLRIGPRGPHSETAYAHAA